MTSSQSDLVVLPPRAEHSRDALGIGERTPRLSWQVQTSEPGWVQRAYEVQGLDDAGQVQWSTGVVESRDSVLVAWPGPALASRERVHVRTRVWGSSGDDPSAWSDTTRVEAGLLDAGDWSGTFVGPALAREDAVSGDRPPVLLRREFEVGPDLVVARIYATAVGVYDLELNGVPVGDIVLAPGWTSYHNRIEYQTYDVTALLREGRNVAGAHLADGWWRGSYGFNRLGDRYGDRTGLLLQLELTYADGRRETLATDETWRWSASATTRSSIYDGERHDARFETRGWSTPDVPADDWLPVEVVTPEVGRLVAPVKPPVRRIEERAPVSVEHVADDTYLLDFGQNLVGRLRITVDGPAGTAISFQHAEVLQDGRAYTRPLRTALAHDEYVLAGHGPETWEPRFTFHGFRYAEIAGWPGELSADDVRAVVIHDDMQRTGWFSCSEPLLDRLHENAVWSMKGNFVSIPTDCPQRDERLGWTGDLQIFAPAASFLFDSAGSMADWLRDVSAETGEDGLVPLYVPHLDTQFPQFHCAAWGDAATVVPLVLRERFGDGEPVESGYDTARAWVEGCVRLLDEYDVISSGMQLGDWLDPAAPPDRPQDALTDPYLVATAYLAHSARLLSRQAGLVGKGDDASRYADLADRVAAGFRREFVSASGRTVSDTQTAYALALRFDLFESDEQRRHAHDRLRQRVREAEFRVGTGFAGSPEILFALSDGGALEEAYRMLLEKACPSWLYTVTSGATTIWERWDSLLPDGTVNPGGMTSFNHYAYGSVTDWMHRVVAGLAPAAPGYRTLLVRPQPGGGLTRASARHLTPYGEAEVSWKREGTALRVSVLVPANTDARVELPGQDAVVVGSGRHEFEVAFPAPEEDPIAPLPRRTTF